MEKKIYKKPKMRKESKWAAGNRGKAAPVKVRGTGPVNIRRHISSVHRPGPGYNRATYRQPGGAGKDCAGRSHFSSSGVRARHLIGHLYF